MGTLEITRGNSVTILKTSLTTDHDEIAEWVRRRLEFGPVSITELFDRARRSNLRDKSLACVLNTLVKDGSVHGDESTQSYTLAVA
jgi:hypothetical protein